MSNNILNGLATHINSYSTDKNIDDFLLATKALRMLIKLGVIPPNQIEIRNINFAVALRQQDNEMHAKFDNDHCVVIAKVVNYSQNDIGIKTDVLYKDDITTMKDFESFHTDAWQDIIILCVLKTSSEYINEWIEWIENDLQASGDVRSVCTSVYNQASDNTYVSPLLMISPSEYNMQYQLLCNAMGGSSGGGINNSFGGGNYNVVGRTSTQFRSGASAYNNAYNNTQRHGQQYGQQYTQQYNGQPTIYNNDTQPMQSMQQQSNTFFGGTGATNASGVNCYNDAMPHNIRQQLIAHQQQYNKQPASITSRILSTIRKWGNKR